MLPADGAPASIQVVEGDEQSGRVGVALGRSRRRAGDRRPGPAGRTTSGSPLPSPTRPPRASVAPDTGTTDSDGRVTFQVMMGGRVGRLGAELRVVGAGPLIAPRRASPRCPPTRTSCAWSAETGRAAPAGTVLAEPLVVQVTDAFGNPIAGVPIDWSVDGGGSVSAATTAYRRRRARLGGPHARARRPASAACHRQLPGPRRLPGHVHPHGRAPAPRLVLEAVLGNGQTGRRRHRARRSARGSRPGREPAIRSPGSPSLGLWVTVAATLTPATSITDQRRPRLHALDHGRRARHQSRDGGGVGRRQGRFLRRRRCPARRPAFRSRPALPRRPRGA